MSPVLYGSEQLRRLFAAMTENVFQVDLGIADPLLTDYIADLLCRFVRMEAIIKIRDAQGRRLEEVAEMLVEARDLAITTLAVCEDYGVLHNLARAEEVLQEVVRMILAYPVALRLDRHRRIRSIFYRYLFADEYPHRKPWRSCRFESLLLPGHGLQLQLYLKTKSEHHVCHLLRFLHDWNVLR